MKDIVVPRVWEVTPKKDYSEERLKKDWDHALVDRLTRQKNKRISYFSKVAEEYKKNQKHL